VTAPRAELTLAWSELLVQYPDGGSRWFDLDGCASDVVDAAFQRRFVRMLTIERGPEWVALITPPDRASIAPRVAHLPAAPADAAVLDEDVWGVVVMWVSSGGRLAGMSIAELARLAMIAAPQFALIIGEVAAQVALDIVGEQHNGPLRSGVEIADTLAPLERAARGSPRAAEALVAALAACATRRRFRW
jgi:hypothetical protein